MDHAQGGGSNMTRPKSNGPYAPLSATYYRDDAILRAGEPAELLFVRCLAFLADSASDGYITDSQMRLVVGMGMRNVSARCARLVELGLLTCVDDAYLVRSWLKWNKTTDEIGKHLKRDRARKQAEKDRYSARNDDGIQTDSGDQINTNQVTTHQYKDVAEIRPDVSRLCNILADLIEKNGSKRPTIGKSWIDSARLMLDNDNRPVAEALSLIQWSQASGFWRGNILSMPKFRDKYDTLRLQRDNPGPQAKETPEQRARRTMTLATDLDLKGIES